jgi:arylsulfatase A-like enzyme
MQVTRRQLLQAGAAGAAGAALLPAAGCTMDQAGSREHMNVLLLIVDSLRPDHVGAYGSEVKTPNLDALLAKGIRFTRGYPEAMVTIPARRSIFTAKRIFPYRNWKPNLELGRSPGWLPITDLEHTFTAEFQRHGYWTAQVSDNPHLGFTKAYKPFRKSFDHWASIPGQAGTFKPASTVPLKDVYEWLPPFLRDRRYIPGMREYLANSGAGVREDETCAARVYIEAINTIDAARLRQPFCLTVDCFDPHEPWSPVEKYLRMYADPNYKGEKIGVTKYGFARNFSEAQFRELRAIYAAEVTQTDRWLGKFMDRFYASGLAKNTVILMLSDHGYLLGERGYTGKVPSQLHPELAQIVYTIVHPDGKGAGETHDYFASTHDVGPTLLSLVGIKPPGWMEGADLSPVLDGGEPTQTRDFHYGGMFNRFYIRTDDWVLIGDNRGENRTLNNLRTDPSENHDVIAEHPDVSRRLYRQILDAAGGPLPYYQ